MRCGRMEQRKGRPSVVEGSGVGKTTKYGTAKLHLVLSEKSETCGSIARRGEQWFQASWAYPTSGRILSFCLKSNHLKN
jgi:hypothetical protein